MNKKNTMLNKLSFGQRVANIWQELVEHLNTLSNMNDDEGGSDRDQEAAAGGGE